MGVLLLDYIINARKETGTMPANPAFLKTIVTTNMGREVAERNGVHVDETFTGFKFMAEKLAEYKRESSYNYLLAYEESYGLHGRRLCARQGRRHGQYAHRGDGRELFQKGHDPGRRP